MTRSLRLAAALFLASSLPAQAPDIGAPPGRLIDIGGRKLHLICSGNGSPTVVIEAGASSFAIDFTVVQQDVARTNRVCAYDRAGHGWSDPSPEAPNATVTADLHALLEAASEKPPYVLVGASLGGLFVRLYHADYPEEVVGLVLVDPATEERLFTYFEGQAVAIASLTAEQFRSTIPTGSIRVPPRSPQLGPPFDRLPPDLYALRVKLEARLIASMPEVVTYEMRAPGAERDHARLARLRALSMGPTKPLGDRPLVVLTRGVESSDGLREAHGLLTQRSTNSRHTVVGGAGHEIHLFAPQAVVQAISDVVQAARSKTQLPAR